MSNETDRVIFYLENLTTRLESQSEMTVKNKIDEIAKVLEKRLDARLLLSKKGLRHLILFGFVSFFLGGLTNYFALNQLHLISPAKIAVDVSGHEMCGMNKSGQDICILVPSPQTVLKNKGVPHEK